MGWEDPLEEGMASHSNILGFIGFLPQLNLILNDSEFFPEMGC